jgi:ElaA protein
VNFIDNLLLFGRVLRAAGVHIHRERMVDAIQAIEWIGVRSRADLRAALCALLVHRQEDLPVFNEAFDLFFRARGESALDLPLFSLGERARIVTRRDAGAPQRLDVEGPETDAAAAAAFALGAYSTVEVSRTKDFADFTPAELYAVLALRQRVFVVEQACPYPELDGRDAEPGTVHLWFADDEGGVLSTIRVLENGEDRSIGRVATAVPARGRGLSAQLIRRGIELCEGRTIDIGAQAHLEEWYARFGFRRSGPGYVEDGIPHVPMRREP